VGRSKKDSKDTRSVVYVCVGKDCRGEKRRHKALLNALDGKAEVREVGCQKICDGPVCGLSVSGKLTWFEEIDSNKVLGALLKVVEGGQLGKALKKRQVKSRRGKLRA